MQLLNTHSGNSSCSFRENQKKILPPESLYNYYFQGRIIKNNLPNDPYFLGDWEEGGHSFLFFSRSSPESINNILDKQPDLSLCDEYQVSYSEWQGGYVASFEVGNLKIVPVWDVQSMDSTGCEDIVFDPGVVFGTGNHVTTRDCLKAMQYVYSREQVYSVLDIGSGSGLLSLAAAKLGSSRVLALDNNPLAALTSKNNICLNKLDEQVLSIQAKGEDYIHLQTDLLIANIHFDIMDSLVSDPGFVNKRWCILSGLMSNGGEKIRAKLSALGCEIAGTWISDDIWHTFLARVN